jgi:thiamine-phosphate diphosphorylase
VALAVPRLLIVADLDTAGSEARWLALLCELAEGLRGAPGVALQVRAKGRPAHDVARLAQAARTAAGAGPPLILNGPAELARSLGYEGVHWPEAEVPSSLPVAAEPLLRSAAAHSLDAVRRASAVAHYAVFGPVFPPRSKGGAAAGLSALRAICAASPLPVVAIGGIDAATLGSCIASGAAGIAVVSAVVRAERPAEAAIALLRALDAAP